MLAGPPDPIRECVLWDDRADAARPHPWGADEYLFGVWELLSGQEENGYERLTRCLEQGEPYIRQYPGERGFYNRKQPEGSHEAVIYCNAQLFTKPADRWERMPADGRFWKPMNMCAGI